MRTGMIIFGVILLILGAVFYFVPTQSASAVTTTVNDGGVNTSSSSAAVSIPWALTLATSLIGAVLLILGLAFPGPYDRHTAAADSTHEVEKRDHLDSQGRKHTTVHERHVEHRQRE